MDPQKLENILQSVKSGSCSVAQAMDYLRHFPGGEVTDGCIDHQRQLRTGIPEVIYGASKTAEQITTIAAAILAEGEPVLATRVSPDKAEAVLNKLPDLEYNCPAGLLIANKAAVDPDSFLGRTVVVCAGTSDIPVAEEARLTLETFGHPVDKLYDTGVAGLHRLLRHQDILRRAAVIIVVAGMEGALPSVVGGLVSCPVIAVPTSVGAGHAEQLCARSGRCEY
jgi:NCAIR mutase (PurE)-related protein